MSGNASTQTGDEGKGTDAASPGARANVRIGFMTFIMAAMASGT
jgi:hypothetical protein